MKYSFEIENLFKLINELSPSPYINNHNVNPEFCEN